MATQHGRRMERRGERLIRLAYDLEYLAKDARADLDDSAANSLLSASKSVRAVGDRYLK